MIYKFRFSLPVFFIVLGFFAFSQIVLANPGNPLDEVQQRIAEAGAYSFSADVEQTLIPRASVATIGQQDERVDVRITGQVELPNTAHLSMLFEGGGLNGTPITLEQEGENTYLISNGERQLIDNPAGASAAPGGDYTAYLNAAENVQLKESDADNPFTVYTYDINGTELANYMARLAQQSSPLTAYGVRSRPSSLLQNISGTGEIWIDESGLPRRQILDLALPEMTADYNLESRMEINFVFAAETEPTANINVGVPLVGTQRDAMPDGGTHKGHPYNEGNPYDQSISPSQLVNLILGIAVLVFSMTGIVLVLRNRRWRRTVVPVSLVFAILFTPILRVIGINVHTSAEAETVSFTEALGIAPENELNLEASLPAFQADSSPANACGNGDEAADTDQDGLNDFVENCLGTDSYYSDSDRDTITDTLEVAGFSYNGQIWYSNPLKADSNADGLSDIDEWEQPIGYAPSIDPDNDGIPNLWDDDNDGDGVPDEIDLDPFSVTGFQDQFSISTVDGGDSESYQYFELQLQPENLDHLRYSTTYLDWPLDTEGTLQDLDNSTEDMILLPMLEIKVNNVPEDFLLEDYGVTRVNNIIYVMLTPVSNGGQISAFSGKVAYAAGELESIDWESIKLVWMAQMENDSLAVDEIETESLPVGIYEEKFRLTGLQISKSKSVNTAVFGTPNSPADNRDLFNVLMGMDATYLEGQNPNLATLVDRFSNSSTSITETWGVPAADVAVSATSSSIGHTDNLLSDLSTRLPDFLNSNNYPTDDLATVLIATEIDTGAESLDALSADLTDVDSFSFNLAAISSLTVRTLQLSHRQYNGTAWETVEINDVMETVEGRYSDFDAGLAELEDAYPDLEENDLLFTLYIFYGIWSTGDGATVALERQDLADGIVNDSDIYQLLNEPSISNSAAYLIEAADLASADGGLVIDTVPELYEYLRSSGGTGIEMPIELAWISASKDLARGFWNLTWLGSLSKGTGVNSVKTSLSIYAKVGNYIQKSNYGAIQSLGKFVTNHMKQVLKIAKIVGVVVEITLIWVDYGNFHSIFEYEYSNALAYAITATVAALVLAVISATVFGAILVGILLIIEFIVFAVSGGESSFMEEVVTNLSYFFFNADFLTRIDFFDFRNLSTWLKNGDTFQVGSTLVFKDTFRGAIVLEDGGQSRLENSEYYGYFSTDAVEGIGVSANNARDDSYCFDGAEDWYHVCVNELQAEFELNEPFINTTVEVKYQVKAKTYYEECVFGDCSAYADNLTLPDALESEDQWDSMEIVIDVLPETLDELWGWSAITNSDPDGDGVASSLETGTYGTDPNDWDSDGDGLSDEFEIKSADSDGTNATLYDTDGDGLNDGLEYQLGTIINDKDSDNDGREDGEEHFHWNGSAWEGGGYFIDIKGQAYWVFSDPLSADADGDGLNDGSEEAAGTSPSAFNDAPHLTLKAGPWAISPSGEAAVVVAPGDAITATFVIDSYGPVPVTSLLKLCPPASVTGVSTSQSGDRSPAEGADGSCTTWDFGGENSLQIWEQFSFDMTATTTGDTDSSSLEVSLPYQVGDSTETIITSVPILVDNTAPEVFISDPLDGATLNGTYYVLGGTAADVFGRMRVRILRRMLHVSKNGMVLREHHKFTFIEMLRVAKETVKTVAERFAAENKLVQPDDVYFLSWPELLLLATGDLTNVYDTIAQRRASFVQYEHMTPPAILTSDGETPAAKYHVADAPEGALVGNPVSPGIVEGTVHVIRDPQTETLASGDILVAPFTDPGWTPLFINAAGLIMEVGGAMTHGSVVAREYGIPAIVGVPNATTELKTGQRVRIDGNRGVIEVL